MNIIIKPNKNKLAFFILMLASIAPFSFFGYQAIHNLLLSNAPNYFHFSLNLIGAISCAIVFAIAASAFYKRLGSKLIVNKKVSDKFTDVFLQKELAEVESLTIDYKVYKKNYGIIFRNIKFATKLKKLIIHNVPQNDALTGDLLIKILRKQIKGLLNVEIIKICGPVIPRVLLSRQITAILARAECAKLARVEIGQQTFINETAEALQYQYGAFCNLHNNLTKESGDYSYGLVSLPKELLWIIGCHLFEQKIPETTQREQFVHDLYKLTQST